MSSPAEAETFIQHLIDDNAAGRRDYWMIIDEKIDQAIGTIGFNLTFSKLQRMAEVGHGLSHRYWSSDALQIAGTKLLEYGFGELGLERIQSYARMDNRLTIEALKKLGFIEETILHEFYYTDDGRMDGLLMYILGADFKS